MKIQLVLILSILFASTSSFGFGKQKPTAPLETVSSVDLNRYTGLWYEIARLPHRFEKGCVAVTAQYRLRDDGKISVENSCHEETLDGPVRVARGVARVTDSLTRSKLEVSFFGPFWGDYWILELGPQYEYAVVGSPDRDSLWILSRTPQMNEELVKAILARRSHQGFDISRVEFTPQAK